MVLTLWGLTGVLSQRYFPGPVPQLFGLLNHGGVQHPAYNSDQGILRHKEAQTKAPSRSLCMATTTGAYQHADSLQ